MQKRCDQPFKMRFLHVLLAVTMETHQESYSASANYDGALGQRFSEGDMAPSWEWPQISPEFWRHILTISISNILNVLTHAEDPLATTAVAICVWGCTSLQLPFESAKYGHKKTHHNQFQAWYITLQVLNGHLSISSSQHFAHPETLHIFASTLTRLCLRFPICKLQGRGTLLSCRSVATSVWMWELLPSWAPGDQSRDKKGVYA